MLRILFFSLLLVFSTSKLGYSQGKVSELPTDLATKWFDLQLKLVPKTQGFSPPVVARTLGYSGLTLYEALVHGMPQHHSLVGQLTDLNKLPQPAPNETYHWGLVANTAMEAVTSELFFNMTDASKLEVKQLKDTFEKQFATHTTLPIIKRSTAYGQELAKAILKYAATDGGHRSQLTNFLPNFKPATGACFWIPVGDQQALQPNWGQNRVFISSTNSIKVPPPPACESGKSSLMYAQALEVYSVGKNLTDEQREIAQFWADDAGKTFTPPGHGMSIALQLIKKENLSLEKSAELICRLGIAASDAFVACWKCKYEHKVLRPVTYITTIIDPLWKPILNTPPFPEYTSGHASVSGAMAIVLADMFGYNYTFTDASHQAAGFAPRSFDSFWDYAQEAAVSRLYGGIHYRMSNEQGLLNGKKIGKAVCALPMKKSS